MRNPLLVSVLFSTLMACGDNLDQAEPGMKLVSTEVEPPGSHCAAGGVAVRTGYDDNHNGMIDAGELYSTSYSCSHQTVLREDTIGSGAVCPGGGVQVRSGHDLNDNGSLEDNEIEATATVCESDELYRGDLKTSEFQTSASRDRLSHVRVVTGNVIIDASAPLKSLEAVGGNIDVRIPTEVDLPSLDRIAGNLVGLPNGLITGPTPERSVQIKAPLLTTIGGKVNMTSWKEGGFFNAPSLTAVDGEFYLAGKITSVELDQLARVGGALDLDVQPPKLALPALKTVGGRVEVSGWWTELDLHSLETATSFDLYYSSLTELKLPALKTSSIIRVGQSAKLTTVEMPQVSGVTWVWLYTLPQLAVFDLPLVTELDKLTLANMAIPDMGLFAQLRTIKNLKLDKNRQLVDLGGLDQVTTMASLTITENDKLADLGGLENLAAVTGNILIKKNPVLASLKGLAALTNVGGTITITENAGLPQSDVDAFLHRLGR